MSLQGDLHNQLVRDLLPRIIKPVIAAGGDWKDVLVLLESLLAGGVAFVGNGGGDAAIIDHVAAGAKERVEAMRADVKRMMN